MKIFTKDLRQVSDKKDRALFYKDLVKLQLAPNLFKNGMKNRVNLVNRFFFKAF